MLPRNKPENTASNMNEDICIISYTSSNTNNSCELYENDVSSYKGTLFYEEPIPARLMTPSNWKINKNNKDANNNREDKEMGNTNFIESEYFDFKHFVTKEISEIKQELKDINLNVVRKEDWQNEIIKK